MKEGATAKMLKGISKRDIVYPAIIYIVAVAIILTGVRPYFGGDGLLEIWRAEHAIKYGWDWAAKDQNNTSLALTVVTPFLSNLLNMSVVSLFRNLYPFWFALTPVLLFFVFRRLLTSEQALLSALFFAVLPPTYQEIPNIAKSMLAQPFAAAGLLVCCGTMTPRRKAVWLLPLVAVCFSLHYTTGIVLSAWVGSAFLVTRYWSLLAVVVIASAYIVTYSLLMGGGTIANGVSNWNNLDDHETDAIHKVLRGGNFETYSDTMRREGASREDDEEGETEEWETIDGKVVFRIPMVGDIATGQIPLRPETLIRSFGIVPPVYLPFDVPNNVKRGAIYGGILLMFLGTVYWLTHWREMWKHRELGAAIAFSIVTVTLALTVPWVTRGLYVSRWIQMAGIPMSVLVGLSTNWLPKKYSYPVTVFAVLALLVLAR